MEAVFVAGREKIDRTQLCMTKMGFCHVLIFVQLLATACAAEWCGFWWVVLGWADLLGMLQTLSITALVSSVSPVALECWTVDLVMYILQDSNVLSKDLENDHSYVAIS